MGRVTEYVSSEYQLVLGNSLADIFNKLGKLEDILEKYGIESVEELEDYLTPKLFCYTKLSENLDELEKYYQFEPFIHIDTCEPQVELITDKVKDLQHQLAVTEKALELACEYAISNNELYDLVNDWQIENNIDYIGVDRMNLLPYLKQQAEKELRE